MVVALVGGTVATETKTVTIITIKVVVVVINIETKISSDELIIKFNESNATIINKTC